jgi:hypothetical protein
MMQIDKTYIQTRFWKLYSRFLSYAFFEGRPLTTRGRWINPLVFTIYKIAILLPQLKKVDSPIFILGTGRSGTTILGIVMSMHKEIGFLNEPKAIWSAVNPYEDLIGSYSMKEATYFLNEKDGDEIQKRNINKIFGLYLTTTFSKRVVDKYPELIFRIPYVKALFPDAKFLFLVRNGWDTCSSIEKWSERLSTSNKEETQDWWGRDNRKWSLLVEQVIKKDDYFKNIVPVLNQIKSHTDMAALEWIATMRQGITMLEQNSKSILKIDYENLVQNPEGVLKEIQVFCGLLHDDVYINYGQSVLKPVKNKQPFVLHPNILPLFNETMNILGYE